MYTDWEMQRSAVFLYASKIHFEKINMYRR